MQFLQMRSNCPYAHCMASLMYRSSQSKALNDTCCMHPATFNGASKICLRQAADVYRVGGDAAIEQYLNLDRSPTPDPAFFGVYDA